MPLPLGIILLQKYGPTCTFDKHLLYKSFVLILTFIGYTSYHLSRRPLSIAKTVLNQNCNHLIPPHDVNTSDPCWCCWEPFNGSNANFLFGLLDISFLAAYAIFMFFSGFIAERCHLRYFISIGMITTGFYTCLFGIAYNFQIHSINYFFILQFVGGLLNTTGWPAVVSAVANWFGTNASRGLIFGIWNAHACVGNILGTLIAGAFVEYNWGLSFIVPGIIIIALGAIQFLFFTPYPEEVGFCSTNDNCTESEEERLIDDIRLSYTRKEALSFWAAVKVPRVIDYSLCLFFCKLVVYTLLYWLPKYINEFNSLSATTSAFLSLPLDIGGIFGGIIAGSVSDKTKLPGLTCLIMLFFSIPCLIVYSLIGQNYILNLSIQTIIGICLNGPFALISTAVAADIGTKVTNNEAMATIAAIIDGTGSLGAALGPFITGIISSFGWEYVFWFLIFSNVTSMISLYSVVKNELQRIRPINLDHT